MTKKLQKDQILGIIGLLIAAFYTYQSLILPKPIFEGDPGLSLFPLIGCFLIAVCSIALIIHPDKKEKKTFFTKSQWKSAALLFGVYVLDCLFLYWFGFQFATYAILFIITVMFSRISSANNSWKACVIRGVIYSALVGTALWLIYVVALEAQLPRGIVWAMLR